MKKHLLVLGLLLTFTLLSLSVSANGLPYSTYTYSTSTHSIVWTQDAYLPLSISSDLGGLSLHAPQDITIDAEDNLYVADSGEDGNGLILKYSLRTDAVSRIGEGILANPTGVHVGIDGSLYVADFGTKKAYKFVYDEGTDAYVVSATYEKPTDGPYFSATDAFDPFKIVTDRGNNVYLLLSGNINGLAEYENDGTFFGYFGGNRLPATLDNILKYALFDEQQRREWFQMIPDAVYNVAVDGHGLILTTTKETSGYLKLNIANDVYNQSNWGFDTNEDLFVGPYGTVFMVTSDGYIVEYDPDGSLLFVFSGLDRLGQKGLFDAPSGIAVDSKNNLYVVDKTANALQVFVPTQFADYVHSAIVYYQDGQYAQALGPWREVLKMNSLFDLANKGLGDAYYALGDFENAMTFYEVARDREGYSEAFWEVRNDFLLGSASGIVIVLLALLLVSILDSALHFTRFATEPLNRALDRGLRKKEWWKKLMFPFYLFKRPGDGFYGIKREKKGSNLVALLYLFLFFGTYVIWIYNTSFLFNDRLPSDINLMEEAVKVFVPFFLWVIANYLVCSIRDGEGKLTDVFQGSAYSLLPMILAFPLLTLLSKGLSYNESFIYYTVLAAGILLTGIWLLIMVKEIHYYDMKPTIGNILISLFTAVMILAVLFIVFLLLNEVWTLVSDVIRELVSRG